MWKEIIIEQAEPKVFADIRLEDAWEEFIEEFPEKKDEDPVLYCGVIGFQAWLYCKKYKLDLLNSPIWTNR